MRAPSAPYSAPRASNTPQDADKWPRLHKEKAKLRFLSVDWNLWEDSDAEDEPQDFANNFDMDQFSGGAEGGV